ncbi:hypothetical protein ACFWAR_37140 [Streptomyces sp. NPDC059917]|uniref:hypothetical protein n=1 Tax=Streptomyces sp. NPDC059917 TaxID=3347002 RepID=UPI00365E4979
MSRTPSEPELPDPVPVKRDAITPDLPPAGPAAPDLRIPERGRPRRDGSEDGARPEGERSAAGPGNAPPQESTD